MVTEVIHNWGAYVGETADLPPPDDLNARGRWEYAPLWELLAELGEFDAGRSWWDASFPDLVADKGTDPYYRGRAHELMQAMDHRTPWVWKDPALCHFLDFWLDLLPNPVVVATVRHPIDVAVSWQQYADAHGQGSTTIDGNLLRWQHMTLSVLRALARASDRTFVEYEAFCARPTEQAARLAAFLDCRFEATTSSSTLQRMAAACDPELRRTQHRTSSEIQGVLNDTQRSLYDFLQELIDDPNKPFTQSFPMPPGWRAKLIAEETPSKKKDD